MLKIIISILFKFYSYLLKDFLLFVKRKKFLYLTFLLPIIFGGIFIMITTSKDLNINVSICQFDENKNINEIYRNLDFEITKLEANDTCIQNILGGIKNNSYDLGIVIPQDFTQNLNDLKQTKIKIYHDNTNLAYSNLVSWKIDVLLNPVKYEITNNLNQNFKQEFSKIRPIINSFKENFNSNYIDSQYELIEKDLIKIENLETNYLTNSINTNSQEIYDIKKEKILLTYIFPIICMFIVIMLTSVLIIYDRKSNFILRVKLNSNIALYIFSKIIFFSALTFIQFLIIYILFLFLDVNLTLNFFEALKLILFIGILNSLLGIFIGLISENEGIAILLCLIIVIPQMLLCGLMFPLEIFPNFLKSILQYTPLNIQIDLTKEILLFSNQLSLSIFIYLFLLFVIFSYYLNKKEI